MSKGKRVWVWCGVRCVRLYPFEREKDVESIHDWSSVKILETKIQPASDMFHSDYDRNFEMIFLR